MLTEVTDEILEKGKSSNGGWSKAQLQLFNIDWPPQKGWKNDVVGKMFDDCIVKKFITRRNHT